MHRNPGTPVTRPTLTLYVPAPGSIAGKGLLPGSAIVGDPSRPRGDLLSIHFEGNRYGADSMSLYVNRVLHAYGRLVANYPTTAKMHAPMGELIPIGTCDTWGTYILDPVKLNQWVGVELMPAPESLPAERSDLLKFIREQAIVNTALRREAQGLVMLTHEKGRVVEVVFSPEIADAPPDQVPEAHRQDLSYRVKALDDLGNDDLRALAGGFRGAEAVELSNRLQALALKLGGREWLMRELARSPQAMTGLSAGKPR